MSYTIKRRLITLAIIATTLTGAFIAGWAEPSTYRAGLVDLGLLSSNPLQLTLYSVFIVSYFISRLFIEQGRFLGDLKDYFSAYPRLVRAALRISAVTIVSLIFLFACRGELKPLIVASLLAASVAIPLYRDFVKPIRSLDEMNTRA